MGWAVSPKHILSGLVLTCDQDFFFLFPSSPEQKREERPPDRRLSWFRPRMGSLRFVLAQDTLFS